MSDNGQNNKYSTRPEDFYLSSKEIQEKRGEDLARRLHNFRMSLRERPADPSFASSPYRQSFSFENLEEAFLSEFLHLSDIGKRKFVRLIWVKNVQEEITQIWPEFSSAVDEALKKI